MCQNQTKSFINWEEIELSEHVRKQKKGKEVQVVDPDVFLRLACSTINASTNQTYFYYLKVGPGLYRKLHICSELGPIIIFMIPDQITIT